MSEPRPRLRSASVVIVMVGYSIGSAVGGPLSNLLIPRYGRGSVIQPVEGRSERLRHDLRRPP